MPAYFIGTDPENDTLVRATFGTAGLSQAWGGGWVLVTSDTLDEVARHLRTIDIKSAVIFPFEAGQQITSFDRASRVLNDAIECVAAEAG